MGSNPTRSAKRIQADCLAPQCTADRGPGCVKPLVDLLIASATVTSEPTADPTLGWLTVIGDLVEDIVVWTTGDVIGGTDNPVHINRSRGGSAANVAVLAAPLVSTRFIGAVGDDDIGYQLVEQLRRLGVDPLVSHHGTTGCVVVLVDSSAERTMFPDRAAAGMLGPVSDAQLAGTAILHLPAYGFLTPMVASSITAAAADVHRMGGAVSVDVSATSVVTAFGVEAFRRLLDDIRPEYVFANADETAILGLGADPPPSGCVYVLKRGAAPASLIDAEGTIIEVPALVVAGVRDTTGAGDAFAAGFLAARLGGSDLADACSHGHRLAASVLVRPGAGGQY